MSLKCPICKSQVNEKPEKKWNFEKYLVERFRCTKCSSMFNVYSENGKVAYTIPKERNNKRTDE